MQNLSLSDIYIYPVKSLTGVSLQNSQVFPHGLDNDRLLMLIDDNGLFITQRKYTQLALLSTSLKNNEFKIKAPNFPDLSIRETDFLKETTYVKVWQSECDGIVASNEVNKWFSDYLDKSVRLVKYNHNKPRTTNPSYSNSGDIVSYADGYPLLVISQASLDDLNNRLDVPVTMSHFRPNIVVNGCQAYAEDSWKKIKIGEVEFDAVKKCERCILTTVDPETGVKDINRQPLNTLAEYRKEPAGVMFGMNLIPRSGGMIRRDDLVEILE